MRKSIFQNQVTRALEQERYALLLATLLAAVPYVGWLALALMALVTLRHGAEAGLKLLLPVMLVQTLIGLYSAPLATAILMSVLNGLPCYLAAYLLRATSSWRVVSGAVLGFVLLGTLLFQAFSPDFIMQQYAHLETALTSMSQGQVSALDFWMKKGVSPLVLAHYLFGFQAASMAFSAMVPLLLARSFQSQLFYPGGFREEMLHFRGDKVSVGLLVLFAVLAYFENFFAINCLPAVLFYFVLAGLSFSACAFSQMKPLALILLLILPIIFLSWVVLPLYALIGVVDSLVNFRLYLSSKTGKAM